MSKHQLNSHNTWASLEHWYQSPMGKQLYQLESEVVEQAVDSCFGFCLLQIGQVLQASLIKKARVKYQCIIACHHAQKNNPEAQQTTFHQPSLRSDFEQLPIKSHSIDTVVLFHSLDFSNHPHEILREVDRILIAEGKLIIVAFNPYSLFSLWRYFHRLKSVVTKTQSPLPSETSFIAYHRLKDWLSLLGFDMQEKKSIFFRPPINNDKILNQLVFMEKTGQKYWPFISASYLCVATKRISTLTPIKAKWKMTTRKVLTGRIGEVSHTSSKQKY